MDGRRSRAARWIALSVVGLVLGAAAPEPFDHLGRPLDPSWERKWPPVEAPVFRDSMLDYLQRGFTLEYLKRTFSWPDQRDVTPQFNASLARFCDMPLEIRRSVVSMEMARMLPEAYAQRMEVMRANCALRVFVSERPGGGRMYVAVYGRRGDARRVGRVFTARRGSDVLKIATVGARPKPDSTFVMAAQAAATRLAR